MKKPIVATGFVLIVLLLGALSFYYFAKASDANQQAAAIADQLAQSEENAKTYQSRNELLQEQNTDLQRALGDQQSKLQSAEEKSRSLQDSQKKLKAEVDEAMAAVAAERADFEKKLQATRKELARKDQSLEQKLREAIASKDVVISRLKDQLTVNVADKILFDSGKFQLREEGKAVLKDLAIALADSPNQMLQVQGHTDNKPLSGNSVRIPTNWELSSLRALAAVRFLNEFCGLPGDRLQAVANGEFQPLVPNDSPENRAKNRRIEIILNPIPSS
ncbi:MAG: OmpA family protein [Verrucomicrobiota bacterium]